MALANSTSQAPLLGILGGMGPAATVDLMQKIIAATDASRDQDHVPMVVYNVPQIPDRQKFLRSEGPSPVPAMEAGIATLVAAGAQLIVIPCNTAHFWFDDLSRSTTIPILHIAQAAVAEITSSGLPDQPCIGIMATRGTIAAGFYQERLAGHGLAFTTPTDAEFAQWFDPSVAAVKGGDLSRAAPLMLALARKLMQRGATALLYGCTEVPIAMAANHDLTLDESPCVPAFDATDALARACVLWWHSKDRD